MEYNIYLICVFIGVLAEFQSRYNLQLEILLLVIRFEDNLLRAKIFENIVNITPAMDLLYLKELAVNMITNVLSNNKTQEDLINNNDKIIISIMHEFKKDVDILLSEEIINKRIKEYEEEVAMQGSIVIINIIKRIS